MVFDLREKRDPLFVGIRLRISDKRALNWLHGCSEIILIVTCNAMLVWILKQQMYDIQTVMFKCWFIFYKNISVHATFRSEKSGSLTQWA